MEKGVWATALPAHVGEAQAPRGVEVRAERIRVLSEAVAPPPFELHRPHITAQLPTIFDHAAVGLRHPRHRAIFRLSAAAVAGFRTALNRECFIEVHTPKVVASATESGADVFPVDYFGRSAYLAQSPQFYKQTLVGVFERVFEVGPVFRAELHATPRHLNEYVSLDAEFGFIEDHTTVMALLDRVVDGMLASVACERDALEVVGCALPTTVAIPRIDFAEAQRLIEAATGEHLTDEPDLAPAHERWLGEWALREHGSDFVFVTGYPLAKRPFYTHPHLDRSGASNSFDLIFRGLEVATGSQRLHRYADYLAALANRGIDPESLAGYLEAFRHGMPPHGALAWVWSDSRRD